MSRKSWVIKIVLCLCLLLVCPVGSVAEEETVRVTMVDSLLFSVDEPSQSVPVGGDVSFCLTMRDGYMITSCNYEDYEVSGQDGLYTLTLHHVTRPGRVTVTAGTEAQEANTNPAFTCAIRYVCNDGTAREKTEQYTLSYHLRPNTWNGNSLERDGYTLLCWNTCADGSGEDIGLGSRVTVSANECLTLYGKWVEWEDASHFITRRQDGTLVLTGYRGSGNADMLVIPGKINGVRVTRIASSFTTSMRCGSLTSSVLVLPSTIEAVEDNAFLHSSFREIYFFDSLQVFGSNAFPNAIATIHLNAAVAPRLQKENYNVRFADNIDLLILNQDRKKMVFFSGCSMCYGFDSRMAAEAFEDYVIVDAGLNGEFDALFQVQCMMPYLSDGDVFVHAPEQKNAHQFFVFRMVDSRVYCMAEGNYDLLALADFSNNAHMMEAYTAYATFRQRSDECTYADYNPMFNNYGDYVVARPYDESTETRRDIFYSEGWGFDVQLLTEENIANLLNVYDQLQQRGVSVFFSWAPMNEGEKGNEELRASGALFQEKLRELLDPYHIPVISEVTDYIYPGRYFYDTDYHLNDLGVTFRTEQLIADIKCALEKEN